MENLWLANLAARLINALSASKASNSSKATSVALLFNLDKPGPLIPSGEDDNSKEVVDKCLIKLFTFTLPP